MAVAAHQAMGCRGVSRSDFRYDDRFSDEGEIIWLEMTFGGQVVQGLDYKGVEALLAKLKSKLSIGALLSIKAEAQGLTIVEDIADADEFYEVAWAMNAAAVTQLLID